MLDPEGLLKGIDGGKTTRPYQDEQVVFSQGDAPDAVSCQGRMKLLAMVTDPHSFAR